MRLTWREYSIPIIQRVLVETFGQPEAEVRKALHDAYPFGERAHHPYKIWCDEVNIQLGKKQKGQDRPSAERRRFEMQELAKGKLAL